ncbi:MAG TPA: hypothetical protein VK846_03815, partial [Candidatus Limnocylindria bacterium]|nr:hypothetical protein [Candidatus Limnocylindria bacterium]
HFRRRSGSSYCLTIRFQSEAGKSFTERVPVSIDDYLKAGATPKVKVHYLPNDPKVCAAGQTVEIKFGSLVTGLFMVAGAVLLIVFFKQPLDEQEAAEAVVSEFGKLCVGHHEYAPADARRFPHLDLAWLDAARQRLESHGFTFLQDTEDLTFARDNPAVRTLLRVHLGRQGTGMAALYHLKPQWWMRMMGAKEARVCDIETEFSNGMWVCTGNAQAAGALDQPPGIDTIQLPASTPIEAVVQAHDARVAKFLARHPEVRPLVKSGLEDLLRAQNKLEVIKSDFRKERGVSKAELERMAGVKNDSQLDAIHAEAARLHHEQKPRAA